MSESKIFYIGLEQLELTIDQSDIALEAYGLTSRILDIFSRLISNIKTHLTSFNKKFKRSELHFYHDAKRRGIDNVYKTNKFDKQLLVPIPSGMKVSYIEAVNAIHDLFKQLDIESTTDLILSYLKSTPLKSPEDVTEKINKLTKIKLENELRDIFSSKKTLDVQLHTVISNFSQLKEVDTKILDFEPIFKKVSLICEKLNTIEKTIDHIVTELENNKTIDRSFVKNLHLFVKTIAFQYDAFGVILFEASRIEHNFVLLLEKLVRSAANDS